MKNKVVFLIGTLSGGGAERAVSNISLSLPDYIDREIILFGREAKVEYEYKGSIKKLDNNNLAKFRQKILTLFKRIKKIRTIKKQNPDSSIISFLEYPNLLNILSGINYNSIVSVRNFMSTKHKKGFKAFFWNLSIKYLYKRARSIIVVSKQMKNDLVENYNLPEYKVKVIYNSYPIKTITDMTNEYLTNKEKEIFRNPTIITAGRLNKQKGQHHLLQIFKEVKSNNKDAQLVFLGEGSLETYLRELARKFEISDSVHFFGFKENPFKYIARSDVFVMTSYFEGFPNALAEAMACKVPVISTDCLSGPREILAPDEVDENINYDYYNHRYGFLVPDFNRVDDGVVENKIANLTHNLLNNKEMRNKYASRAYERVKDFDIDKIIDDWSNLITHTNQL